jgi:hypothetical protein
MLRIHLDVLYARRAVSQKTDILCVVWQKEKKMVLKKAIHETFPYFFPCGTQKMLVFRETWPAHIEYQSLHAKTLFGFLLTS